MLPDLIASLVVLLHEPRICTPDVKEGLVGVLGAMLDSGEALAEFEASEVARRRLVGAAVAAFDTRQWHPVSQVGMRAQRGLADDFVGVAGLFKSKGAGEGEGM